MSDHEEQVRLRAYALWEAAGRPEGATDEYWLAAEQEIAVDGEVETASEDSFPASDPPAHTGTEGPA